MKHNIIIRSLHKLLAILIILQLAIGFGFAYGLSKFGWLYTLHKSFGVTIFVVTVLLISVRLISKKIPYNPPLPIWQLLLSKIVHIAMYVSILGMSLSGILASIYSSHSWKIFYIYPFPQVSVPDSKLASYFFSYHFVFATPLLVLIVLHIAAAIYHRVVVKDNVMKRMF